MKNKRKKILNRKYLDMVNEEVKKTLAGLKYSEPENCNDEEADNPGDLPSGIYDQVRKTGFAIDVAGTDDLTFQYLKSKARSGNVGAMNFLANFFEIKQDYYKTLGDACGHCASFWFEQAARLPDRSINTLDLPEFLAEASPLAFTLLGVEAGDPEALTALGTHLVDQCEDDDFAVLLLKKAAEKGDPHSAEMLHILEAEQADKEMFRQLSDSLDSVQTPRR